MSRRQPVTRERIQEAARELFAAKGVQRTSLQDIADRLHITKPALYYHFSSRDELVRSVVEPLLEGGAAFLADRETRPMSSPRELLESYFDFYISHRAEIVILLTELTNLAEIAAVDTVLTWRTRLTTLLFGPTPTLEQSTRAVVALGGLQDCTIQFPDIPVADLRRASVDAAMSALGLE